MKTMWFMEKPFAGTIIKAAVFDEEEVNLYLREGYKVTGKYEIRLLEGNDFLPDAIGEGTK